MGNYTLTKLLVEKEANVNARLYTRDNVTPLHLSCSSGNREVVQFLIKSGADINACTRTNGQTPLHWAVEFQCEPIIEVLTRYGADPHGHTAASLAAYTCRCYFRAYKSLKDI
jgi:ankyrin repeat protein